MSSFQSEVDETARWLASPRFEGITRLYSARQVVEQRGTIQPDYTVARITAERFYTRLRELFAARKQITTFGPYSPGQAVALKRAGIEAIYLGGWATSAKGSVTEDPGPDLAELSLERRTRRGGTDRARPADGGPQPALRQVAHDRGAAGGRSRDRLPALHHRGRRHWSRRRRARAQPRPSLRRGRRSRLSHRRPEARRQEVRASGREGAGRGGRADQAPQRRAIPVRHHEGARPGRCAHRRRVGDLSRGTRGRARPPVHPGRDERRAADVQDRIPGHPQVVGRAGHRGCARAPVVRGLGRGIRRGQRLAGPVRCDAS